MVNRPSRPLSFGSPIDARGYGIPLNSKETKNEGFYNAINKELRIAAGRFGTTTSQSQIIQNLDPSIAVNVLGRGNISGLGGAFDVASSLGIKPEEYGGNLPSSTRGLGSTGREADENYIKLVLAAEDRARQKISEKQRELDPLRSQVKQLFGFDLGHAETFQNKAMLEQAVNTDIQKISFGSGRDYTLEGTAAEHNKLVNEFNSIAEQIEKENNPLLANRRAKEQLEPLSGRISELQSDYQKVEKNIVERTPRMIEVGDYGKTPNRFKDIQNIRQRISYARSMNEEEIAKDPYKKQAIALIDDQNYSNIEKQLMFEEKAHKKAIGQDSVNRGSSQVPQILGGSGPPPLPVPVFPQGRQYKSNILSGLPTDPLDIGMNKNMGIGKMSSYERRMISQQKQRHGRKNKMFPDFNFGGW